MKRIITTAAILYLGFTSLSAQAVPILSVDADTTTDGIQDSLTVNLGDTFSILTLVTAQIPFADAFDTMVFDLASSADILTLADAILADALAATAPILAFDVFGGVGAAPGSSLTQGGATGTSIGLQSLALPFGGVLGLAGLGDIGVALYTFTAAELGTTVLSMAADSPTSGGILANAGSPVPSISLSATITVVDAVQVPEPGTLLLFLSGLALLGLRRRA